MHSKIIMWFLYYGLTCRAGQFGPFHSRLGFMDTDSFFLSYQRQRTSLERLEIENLLRLNQTIPYEQSYVASRLAQSYIKIYGEILDYSSLSEVIFTMNVKKRENIISKYKKIISFFLFLESFRAQNFGLPIPAIESSIGNSCKKNQE